MFLLPSLYSAFLIRGCIAVKLHTPVFLAFLLAESSDGKTEVRNESQAPDVHTLMKNDKPKARGRRRSQGKDCLLPREELWLRI